MNDQNLEKQLNNLPKKRLPFGADIKISFQILIKLARENLSNIINSLKLKNFSLRLAIIVIAAFIIISLPIYAYASNQILPNNLLYPLKISLEQLELKLSGQGEHQAKTLIKLADRRLSEAQALSQLTSDDKSQSSLIKTVNQAVKFDQQAALAIDRIKDEQPKDQAKQAIEQARNQQVSKLNQIAKTVGIKSEEKTLDTIALALDNLKEKTNQAPKKLEENLPIATEEETQASSTEITNAQDPCHVRASGSDCIMENETTSSKINKKITEEKNMTRKMDIKLRQQELKQLATSSLEKLENKVDKLKQDLSPSQYEPDDVKTLFDRLHKKLDEAKQALDKDEINSANGIIESTQALANNAEIFLKVKRNNNSTDSIENQSPPDSQDSNKDKKKPNKLNFKDLIPSLKANSKSENKIKAEIKIEETKRFGFKKIEGNN